MNLPTTDGSLLKAKEMPGWDERFKPNFTPEEMLQAGVFGGTYFRPINSALVGPLSGDYLEFEWSKRVAPERVCSEIYDRKLNRYGVVCGTTLEAWESRGWITATDPRGWFQWYCRYYEGRRLKEEDDVQIARWIGVRSRFSGLKRTPKVMQTFLHWAIDPAKILNTRP